MEHVGLKLPWDDSLARGAVPADSVVECSARCHLVCPVIILAQANSAWNAVPVLELSARGSLPGARRALRGATLADLVNGWKQCISSAFCKVYVILTCLGRGVMHGALVYAGTVEAFRRV